MTDARSGFQLPSNCLPLDFETVEARLIEAVRTFRQLDRKGRSWATDGPWHLSRRRILENWSELWDAHRDILELSRAIQKAVTDPRPDRDMIERAEQASAWLALIPERDRRLVKLVVAGLESGWSQVPWSRLLRAMGLVRGSEGLRKRYNRAIAALAKHLSHQHSALNASDFRARNESSADLIPR